jgi:DNA-binding FadR family transcriptional regulator
MMEMAPTVRKAEHVAQRLLDIIIKSDLAAGVSIGTEAELLEQFNVSRPTLRESLRVLESQGILELRPGPKGGIILRKPSIDMLTHALSVYLRIHKVPFIDVVRAREAIEPGLAAEAAVNGTEEDFAEMQASIDRMRAATDQETFVQENRVFHEVIARASGSRVLAAFWGTIRTLSDGTEYGVRFTSANQQHVIAAHEAILDACRTRDAGLAAQHMEQHVAALEKLVRKRYKDLTASPTRVFNKSASG